MTTQSTVQFIDPGQITCTREEDGFLCVQIGGQRFPGATAWRAFPLSDPDEYISLRDEADRDIGIIRTLQDLDPASRREVQDELERQYFVPIVQRVISAKHHGGEVTWKVETNKGEALFNVHWVSDNVVRGTGTRVIVTDTHGARFRFDDPLNMGRRVAELFQMVL